MYDVIVVGARCAGSPTAMLLARTGLRVLLVDRVTFPSDTFRNHAILSPGTRNLTSWGLLDSVIASNCPPVRTVTFDLGDGPLVERLDSGDDAIDAIYMPRRYVLDEILVNAAIAAGAEFRPAFTVTGLVWENGRVAGIEGRSGGQTFTERTAVVVGADGHRSVVARAVEAPVVREHPVVTFGYYSYFSGVPVNGLEGWITPETSLHLMFPTNDDLTCVAIQGPSSGYSAFKADIAAGFGAYLDLAPVVADRVRAGRREERWLGTGDLPNVARQASGPGWALVGDAGCVKDPAPAHGISDAFRDAQSLSDALCAGLAPGGDLDAALADYAAVRDEGALPSFDVAVAAASLALPPEVYEMRAAVRAQLA